MIHRRHHAPTLRGVRSEWLGQFWRVWGGKFWRAPKLDSGDRVFVHCKEGKDRTGTVVACYRIVADGWGNRKALSEAKSLGMHWYALGMKSYILGFRGL
jgi:hypothetical protein